MDRAEREEIITYTRELHTVREKVHKHLIGQQSRKEHTENESRIRCANGEKKRTLLELVFGALMSGAH